MAQPRTMLHATWQSALRIRKSRPSMALRYRQGLGIDKRSTNKPSATAHREMTTARPGRTYRPPSASEAQARECEARDERMEKEKAPKRAQCTASRPFGQKLRQRPTLPQRHRCSTIGSEELNFRVRDGIGWNLFDITTGKLWIASQPEFRDRAHLPPKQKVVESLNLPLRHDQASRPISTSQLRALQRFHPWPINLVVYEGS